MRHDETAPEPSPGPGGRGPIHIAGPAPRSTVRVARTGGPPVLQLIRERIKSTFDYGAYDDTTDRYRYARIVYLTGKIPELLEQIKELRSYEPISKRRLELNQKFRRLAKTAGTWLSQNQPKHKEDVPEVDMELYYDLTAAVVGWQRELNDSYKEYGKYIRQEYEELSERYTQEEEGMPSFSSLAADAKLGYYTVATSDASDSIRLSSGESGFEEYADGTTVDEAVQQAINGLDLTGSIKLKYSRHDFQPSGSKVHNLQVQLGGSRSYRVGKGDTSSTLVVISVKVFARLEKADANRLKQVLQAAHEYSFKNREKVEIGDPG